MSKYLECKKCVCGALTITTNEGTYSVLRKNAHYFFPDLPLKVVLLGPNVSSCPRCEKQEGLDIDWPAKPAHSKL